MLGVAEFPNDVPVGVGFHVAGRERVPVVEQPRHIAARRPGMRDVSLVIDQVSVTSELWREERVSIERLRLVQQQPDSRGLRWRKRGNLGWRRNDSGRRGRGRREGGCRRRRESWRGAVGACGEQRENGDGRYPSPKAYRNTKYATGG